VQVRHPFTVEATVILPDHLHAIWTLPEGDADFATRWRLIKSAFSRHLAAGERLSTSRSSRRERGIWQRRFWEHVTRRRGLRAARGLRPLQPGEAWARHAGEGLAVFILPPDGARGCLSGRLGRRRPRNRQ